MEKYYVQSMKFSLQERQTKKGKVYDVFFRIITLDGVEKQKKLSGFQTKTLAKQAHADFVTQYCVLTRDKPTIKKNAEKERLKAADVIKQYISSLFNQNKESTIYDKIKLFDRYITTYYINAYMDAITVASLYEWQDWLWTRKNPRSNDFYSYKYLDKIRGFFSSFWSWYSLRYDVPNVFEKLQKPKKRAPKTEMQFWTQQEFEQFISVVDDPEYHCFFTLLFYTGRRKGEVFALEKTDIKDDAIVFNKSLTKKTLTKGSYKVTSTKAEKKQTVPVCQPVRDELRLYDGKEPFFFGGEKPLAENTVTRRFDKWCAAAHVKRIRIHDLRHSFVSMLIHNGANYMVVADLIGDTPEQIMRTYSHIYEADKLDVLSKISNKKK